MDIHDHDMGRRNEAPRLPPGPRRWDSDVAGGRMHVVVEGRVVVAGERTR